MTNPPEFGEPDPTCPLCLRPIPPDVPQSLHHLVPRLKGGKGEPVVRVRHVCGAMYEDDQQWESAEMTPQP